MAASTDPFWLDGSAACTLERLAELSGLSVAEIRELTEIGVLVPDQEAASPSYRLDYVMTVRSARRLRDDFELDNRGMALAMALLHRIGELEAAVAALEARRPRRRGS